MFAGVTKNVAATQQPHRLAAAGEGNKGFSGLHALDGMVILLLSIWLAIGTRHRRQARR